jgi:hypothetical protein
MTRLFSWFLTLFLFGGFASAAVYVLRARADAGVGMPEFSVFSEEANGLAEVARKLDQMGWRSMPLTRLANPSAHHGLLILVEPEDDVSIFGSGHSLSEADVSALLRWVEDGNALLICSRRNSELTRALDVTVTAYGPDNDDTPYQLEPDEAGPYTAGIDRVEVEGRHSLDAERGLPLWWQDDRPAALVMRWGAGRVFFVTDPSFLTARRLHRGADNLVFLASVAALHARDGRVYFDEYHHGIRASGGFWGYLQYHGLRVAFVPVLLVVAVAIWAVAVRLGPAVATPRATTADAVDYASAVAHIYRRAGARRQLGRGLARGFLARLARRLEARPSALPAELLSAWRQRHPKEPVRRLETLLRAAGELRKGDVNDAQLLAWTRAFDEFEEEVVARSRPARLS